jgi:nucleotide-binding universal stress UspA family protein
VASRLAALAGNRLVILHVINPTIAVTPELMYVTDEVRASMCKHADELLTTAGALVPADVPAETLVREGNAAEEIVAAAKEWEAELVVLGTRGRGRLAAFLLGSTADQVVRGAHCPVVTVGHNPDQLPVAGPQASAVAEAVGATA